MSTKTSRELLELAAKAAGIELWHEDVFTTGLTMKVSPQGILRFNSLTDDGDALRLAVKLNLKIECMVGQSAARTFDNKYAGACDYPVQKQDGCNRPFAFDAGAATRLAITLVAAEIGEAMP